MKLDRTRLASMGIAALAFAALSGVAVVMNSVIAHRDRLESRNDVERTLNVLLAGLRDHHDFGAAIESVPSLSDRIVGIGAYADDGSRLYVWGEAPSAYPAAGDDSPVADGRQADILKSGDSPGGSPIESARLYFDDPAHDSVVLVLSPFRVGPPPPALRDAPPDPAPSSGFFFSTLRKAESVYLEVRQPEYWNNRRVASVAFPLVELALAALVLFVRELIVRNGDYRRRIEAQRNLVVLGTAASTLAHEIKNPLLSIRLQTRILEKTCPGSARRELGIIDDEVERLSALSHRVGDYLRDPAGNPAPVDVREAASEVGRRLCGRDVLLPGDGSVEGSGEVPAATALIDPERLRSVLENLVRNALESADPDCVRPGASAAGRAGIEDAAPSVGIAVRAEGGAVLVDVLDRGAGIDPAAAGRAFDPFYTTKSRGTGIGLAVCKRFVEAAGGSIRLEPRPGGGCAARVALPAYGERA